MNHHALVLEFNKTTTEVEQTMNLELESLPR